MKHLSKLTCYCIVFLSLLYGNNVLAQSKRSVFDQLVYINKLWLQQPDVEKSYKSTPAKDFSERTLVKFHLQQTEKLLRGRRTSGLTPKQKASRESHLSALHEYWQAGLFPINDKHSNKQPYFIDKYGTYCAVGYLMKMSGANQMALDINATQNFSYLSEITHPQLQEWVASTGLSFDELALIQPGYGGEWAACITEMHYNNTGTDVNEYIEIHQSNGGLVGLRDVNTVLLYNHLGALYKTLPIASMQIFTTPGNIFYFYSFPAGENFADSGTIRLVDGVSTVAKYTYNSSGISHTDSGAYRSGTTIQRHYNSSENESTVLNTSLTFFGTYANNWSLASLQATPGTLNPLTIGALPVTLSDFKYTLSNKSVELIWETAWEFKTDSFVVEKSSEGVQFTPIGKLKAAGVSNVRRKYKFTDENPLRINHYRIRVIDADKANSFSTTLLVKLQKTAALALGNNVVSNVLQMTIPLDLAIVDLSIYDMNGKEVLRTKASGNHLLDVSFLSTGKYIVAVSSIKNVHLKAQFVKVN